MRLIEGLQWERYEPLLIEMVEKCCKRVVGAVKFDCRWDDIHTYAEDMASLVRLAAAAIRLNLSFLAGGPESFLSSPEQDRLGSFWRKAAAGSRSQ